MNPGSLKSVIAPGVGLPIAAVAHARLVGVGSGAGWPPAAVHPVASTAPAPPMSPASVLRRVGPDAGSPDA
ncbi:hypothetical protein Stsp01_22550 [Streptomyces sp. NBRC 13847]|nr:hypothetical protein Stsp01_22550 [Streptomyces sp. NBRC 13847]